MTMPSSPPRLERCLVELDGLMRQIARLETVAQPAARRPSQDGSVARELAARAARFVSRARKVAGLQVDALEERAHGRQMVV